jgi:hypothetical protein
VIGFRADGDQRSGIDVMSEATLASWILQKVITTVKRKIAVAEAVEKRKSLRFSRAYLARLFHSLFPADRVGLLLFSSVFPHRCAAHLDPMSVVN